MPVRSIKIGTFYFQMSTIFHFKERIESGRGQLWRRRDLASHHPVWRLPKPQENSKQRLNPSTIWAIPIKNSQFPAIPKEAWNGPNFWRIAQNVWCVWLLFLTFCLRNGWQRIKWADDWIWTTDLRCQKQLLYQLCHIHTHSGTKFCYIISLSYIGSVMAYYLP